MDALHYRLDELKIAAVREVTAACQRQSPQALRPEGLPGREYRCGSVSCWQLEARFDDICRRHALERSPRRSGFEEAGAAPAGWLDARRTLVIDIETGGFAGTEVFLIGVVMADIRPLRVIQWLARDYAEEAALLHALAEVAQQRDIWVSFNGKSFDEPFLRDRALIHRVALPRPRLHVDLLHLARRRFRGRLPDCRLQTLERHVLGWQRAGDVPGAEIPGLFHLFMRTRNPAPIIPVIEHNQLDLVSSTELLSRLVPQLAPAAMACGTADRKRNSHA
jgi:uncharacterized protein YprB with RNaseH-like and TPR domain